MPSPAAFEALEFDEVWRGTDTRGAIAAGHVAGNRVDCAGGASAASGLLGCMRACVRASCSARRACVPGRSAVAEYAKQCRRSPPYIIHRTKAELGQWVTSRRK